jgi:hypothetical protein
MQLSTFQSEGMNEFVRHPTPTSPCVGQKSYQRIGRKVTAALLSP